MLDGLILFKNFVISVFLVQIVNKRFRPAPNFKPRTPHTCGASIQTPQPNRPTPTSFYRYEFRKNLFTLLLIGFPQQL